MLASHALALIGVPINRVVRRIRTIRNERYALMRGVFHGASDAQDDLDGTQLRLHSVVVPDGARSVGQTIGAMHFPELNVSVSAIRRRNIRGVSPGPETQILAGDVVVLLGEPVSLQVAEKRLLQGA